MSASPSALSCWVGETAFELGGWDTGACWQAASRIAAASAMTRRTSSLAVGADPHIVERLQREVDARLAIPDLQRGGLIQELEVATGLGGVGLVGDERAADLGVAAAPEADADVPAGDDHDPVPGELAGLEEREIRFLHDEDPIAGNRLAAAHRHADEVRARVVFALDVEQGRRRRGAQIHRLVDLAGARAVVRDRDLVRGAGRDHPQPFGLGDDPLEYWQAWVLLRIWVLGFADKFCRKLVMMLGFNDVSSAIVRRPVPAASVSLGLVAVSLTSLPWT